MNKSVRQFLAEIGRKGGKAKSRKKAIAARKNAKKPRKKRDPRPVSGMGKACGAAAELR